MQLCARYRFLAMFVYVSLTNIGVTIDVLGRTFWNTYTKWSEWIILESLHWYFIGSFTDKYVSRITVFLFIYFVQDHAYKSFSFLYFLILSSHKIAQFQSKIENYCEINSVDQYLKIKNMVWKNHTHLSIQNTSIFIVPAMIHVNTFIQHKFVLG
jgi:hypothetical protein